MTERIKIRSTRFLIGWLAGTVCAWPLGYAIIWFIFLPLDMMLRRSGAVPFPYYADVSAALVGLMIGLCVGVIQRLLLRRYLRWTADHWRWVSALGGMLGVLAIFYTLRGLQGSGWLAPVQESVGFAALVMPLFAGGLALVQTLALRAAVRHGWLWVLANVAGGFVFSGLLVAHRPDAPLMSSVQDLLRGLGAVLAQGYVTAYVMLFLFEKHAYPVAPDAEGAPSVWDEAL